MDTYKIRLIKYIIFREFKGISLQNQIPLLIIEAFIVFVPGIILLKKKKISLKRLLHVFLLVFYAGVILSFTVFRRAVGSRKGIVHLSIHLGFNLTGIHSLWVTTFSILNVTLFIPWGVLISTLLMRKSYIKRVFYATVLGFLTSISVETIQFFTGTGMFEMTDILTNTTGSFIGGFITFMDILLCKAIGNLRIYGKLER